MATPTVLTFDGEGHPVDFESWLEDLHWYLQGQTRDDVSLYEHTSWSLDAPPDSAACVDRSKWTSRDATAALGVHSHLSLDQRSHFRQLKTAKALYDAVVKRYSSPSSATVCRLGVPFLFPEMSDFTTVADLLTHLHSLETCYASLELAFRAENKPPIYLTLNFLTTRLASDYNCYKAESAALADAASCGTPLPSIFEGCSPSLLAPSVASAAAVHLFSAEEVGAASDPSGRRHSGKGKGKGGKGGGGGVVGVAGGAVVAVEVVVVGEEEVEAAGEEERVVGVVGVVEGVGVALGVELAEEELEVRPFVQLRLVVQRVVEVALGVVNYSSRAARRSSRGNTFVSGRSDMAVQVAQLATGTSVTQVSLERPALAPTTPCFFRLDDLYRAEHGERMTTPDWLALLKKDVYVFACDWDVIHAGMYAMYVAFASVEDDCYSCVPRVARSKADVRGVLIRWICAVHLQFHARFRQGLPVLRLHSDQGGEFFSRLLEDFCGAEGIVLSYTLPASPQQTGIAEPRIGLVMEVARTSMIHAVAPHFLWPFAVRYAAEQLNLWHHVSHQETSPTLRWTGEVGDVSTFRLRGVTRLVPTPWPARLAVPPGFPPRSSSPPVRPVAVDSGAARGGDTWGADSGAAGSGGAASPTGAGGAGGAAAGGTAVGGAGGVKMLYSILV
ncbi:unnamed protein product [Closterium sp. NIES-53]